MLKQPKEQTTETAWVVTVTISVVILAKGVNHRYYSLFIINLLIMTLLIVAFHIIMAILITLNTGGITYNDVTYN